MIFLARLLKYIQARITYKREIAHLLNISYTEINKLYKEISNSEFTTDIFNKTNISKWFFNLSMLSVLRAPTLYVLCRILQPEVVVETGVSEGFSSAFILYALQRNTKGHLYSIDLPNQPGQELRGNKATGWLIPESLRNRWTFILGSSKEKLPLLLNDLKTVDIFYHDSDHSYEHMMFEFDKAWEYLKPGNLLLSDDITENNAFTEFVEKKKCTPLTVKLFKLGITLKQ